MVHQEIFTLKSVLDGMGCMLLGAVLDGMGCMLLGAVNIDGLYYIKSGRRNIGK